MRPRVLLTAMVSAITLATSLSACHRSQPTPPIPPRNEKYIVVGALWDTALIDVVEKVFYEHGIPVGISGSVAWNITAPASQAEAAAHLIESHPQFQNQRIRVSFSLDRSQ